MIRFASPRRLLPLARRAATPAARRASWLAALALLGPGCTVFSDYGASTEDARRMFQAGDFAGAVKEYSKDLDATNDSLLYHFEAGAAAHVGEDYDKSRELLATAYQKIDQYQVRALAEDVGQTIGSFLVNEKTLSYTGHVFEQLLLQAYQARNYYLSGKRDGARVEVRRAYIIQRRAKEIYDKELSAARSEAGRRGEGIEVGDVSQKLHEAYDYGDLSQAEDVYDINYLRYLNAWLRENTSKTQADFNDAYVDLKLVAQRFGEVEFVRRDLIRLAELSGARMKAQEMRQQYGLQRLPEDYGSVALFFESGMAPRLEEIKVIFPTYKGAAAVAVPKYESVPNPVVSAVLEVGDHRLRTTTFSNVDAIAFRYHQDRMPLMIAKMVIRLAIKIGIQTGGTIAIEQSTKGTKNEGLGQLLALGFSAASSAWNVVSEQADLRCWRTLPQTLQAARLYLPEGTYPARVVLLGRNGSSVGSYDLGTITVKAGRHRMINARSLGTQLHWDVPREPYDVGEARRQANQAGVQASRRGAEEVTRDVLTGETR